MSDFMDGISDSVSDNETFMKRRWGALVMAIDALVDGDGDVANGDGDVAKGDGDATMA